MERREFLTLAGTAAATTQFRIADFGLRIGNSEVPSQQIRNPQSTIRNQSPTLGPQVFSQRIQRAQDELKARKLDLLVVEPSTNFQYFTGYNPGRSERLILLMVPASGAPVIVCPSFEVERIKRNTVISDARGWEEQENPWNLVAKAVGPSGVVGIEPTTSYQSYRRLSRTLPRWRFEDGALVTERLRIIKSPEEIALIRQAIAATEASIAATFTQLAVDMSERDVSALLSREMASRGSPGGGLVQFGPSSALPHGGPSAGRLTRETVVLIDAGSRVEGYTSDITRTIWFGDAPSDEFKKVYNIVHDAQTAAIENAKPNVTQCQEVDRAAARSSATRGTASTSRTGSVTAWEWMVTRRRTWWRAIRPAWSPESSFPTSRGFISWGSLACGSKTTVR